MKFNEWLRLGMELGYVGPPVCYTHDGLPTTREEDDSWEDGEDPCIHVIRAYDSLDTKLAVEENHSPSVWRNQWRT